MERALPGLPEVRVSFSLRPYQQECLTFTDLALEKHSRVANVLPTGAGKGHPLDTEVPTPKGWRKWGDLRAGDEVFGRDGRPVTVSAVYDRGELPAYRVTFSDGASVEVDGEHLWLLKDEARRGTSTEWGVHETRDVLAAGLKPGRGYRWHVPIAGPLDYEKVDLPLDPYVVGALIANGCMTDAGATLTTPDVDVAARVSAATPTRKINDTTDVCDRYYLAGLTSVTRWLGLRVKSAQKRVPELYLTANFEQRLALLQGLMDGDGSARGADRRSVYYHTTSAGLAGDVVELVNSLGGTARLVTADRSHHGKPTEYQVSILLPSGISPFGTARKGFAGTETRRNLQPKRAIVAIEPAGVKPIRCITVDAPDSLYLITRNYIVTHNTVIFAHMAQRHLAEGDGRVLVLVHTDELVQQAYNKVKAVNPTIDVGIVKAGQNDTSARIIIGSVQTLRNPERRRQIADVTMIIVDECHHATARTYLDIIGHFPSARVVGFTATLGRSDEGDLSKVWQTVAYRRDILWMIRNEYLIDVRGVHVKVDDLDLKKVKKSRGDFQDAALGQALSDSMAPERVAEALKEHGPQRQTICFTPLVASAYEFAAAFEKEGFKAEVVHGALPKPERRAILRRYVDGVTQVLCNAMVLTEGFDAPATSCIIVARPTKSKPLFQQMVGRGLRVDPELSWADQDCLVMVVAGAEMHDLRSIVDLTEKELKPKPGQTLLEAEDDDVRGDGAGTVEQKPRWHGAVKYKEFDPLLRASRRTWGHTKETGARYLAAGDFYVVLLESAQTLGAWDVCWMSRKGGRLAKQGRTEYRGLPLDLAMDWGEDIADRMGGERAMMFSTKGKAWRRKPVSDPQRRELGRLGIKIEDGWRQGDASIAIDEAYASKRIDPVVHQYRRYLEESGD
jgi:superfamily II DNA or RNA helicase